jgi:hypothetical protein
VTLLTDEHGFAVLDEAVLVAAEDVDQATAADLLMLLQAGEFEIRRRKVAHIDEIFDDTTRLDPLPPAHGQRQVKAIFIDLTLHTRERHAMIRSHNDQRVFQNALLLQHGQRPADVRIGIFHLNGVVGHVPAHGRVVGKVARHIDIDEILAQPRAGVQLINAVRFGEAHPETERLLRIPLPQKLGKIRRVIVLTDAGGRWAGLFGVEAGSGRVARASVELVIARPPALAGQTDIVARGFEQIGIDGKLGREDTAMAGGLLKLPGIAPGENRGTTGAALRIGSEGVFKQHALLCHPVKVRRFDPVTAIRARMLPAPVVKDDEQDVRTRWVSGMNAGNKGESGEEGQQQFHVS